MTYGEIFEKAGWPELKEDDRAHDILMICTPYPTGTSEQLVESLKTYAKRSNKDVDKAMELATIDLDKAMGFE